MYVDDMNDPWNVELLEPADIESPERADEPFGTPAPPPGEFVAARNETAPRSGADGPIVTVREGGEGEGDPDACPVARR
ncbi:hypothetical protein [Streptomyces sp. NPDC050504]|uniref:hypothetical protein n=1 Tax=Streptomyces sp. NPDC050504 TaxID=3365618 RepID=UPI0037A774A3